MFTGFTGEHTQKMDTKGRVIVPAKFREALENNIVITRGLDGCLFAYSKEAFEALQAKLSSLPFTDSRVRDFNRFFLAGAYDLETDKLGRVLMPSVLRKFASLDKEVVWIGVGNRIEIWDIDKWNERMMQYLDDSDDVVARMDDITAHMAELGV